MIKACIAVACAAIFAVVVYPLASEHRPAADRNEYRKAVMIEAFSNYQKARPERRARQLYKQVETRPPTGPAEPGSSFTPFPSVFSQ